MPHISALLNFDVLIFITFLAANLVVGLRYGRGVKNIRDYALGGRNFSTAALVATIVATWASGSGFFTTLSKTYSDGLYYLIPRTFMSASFLITGYFMIPRMGEFLGNTSVAEAMGDIYGKQIRIITAVCGILGTMGAIAVQFKVFGSVFAYFLGISGNYSIYIASLIVIIYSAFGGVRAVTYTDVVQFITFGFVIPLIGIIIWDSIYDKNVSFNIIAQNPNFDLQKIFDLGNPKFWEMIPLLLYFAIPTTGAIAFQRISMGRNIYQARKAWLIAAFLLVIVEIVTAWIPFLLEAINPNLPPNQIINYIVDNYVFTGFKGLIMIGIASMAMSTADSRINAASVLFANDISKVLNIKISKLTVSKIFSIILGVFSIYLALYQADLLKIIMTSASFYIPIVTVPLLMTIFGFRSTKKSVLIGMVAGGLSVLTLNILKVDSDQIIILSMLANLVFLMGSHYLLRQAGGWVGIKDTSYLDNLRLERRKRNQAIINYIKKFNFLKFCKENSPTDELTYMWLGIYLIIQTFTTMYSTHVALLTENGKMILISYQIMMVTGVVMAMYPIWPPRLKYLIFMQLMWNFVIFYMLIFFTAFFVMVSDFGRLQFLVLGLNMVIAAVLVGWRLGIAMAVVGFPLSIQFYKFYARLNSITAENFDIDSKQFLFAYALMLAGAALIIFLKPKQDEQKIANAKLENLVDKLFVQSQELESALALKEQFIRNINHEYNAPMTGILSMAQVLDDSYDKFTDEQRKEAIKTIFRSAVRLDHFDNNINSLARLNKLDYRLRMMLIDFSDLVYERVKHCRKLYEDNADREFTMNIEENLTIRGDKQYIVQVLDNLIVNAITYGGIGTINVTVRAVTQGSDDKNNVDEDKDGNNINEDNIDNRVVVNNRDGTNNAKVNAKNNEQVEFIITDEGIGIPQEELYEIFDAFTVSSRTRTIAGGRGVGLALCKRVLEMHGGTIRAESKDRIGASFILTLPRQ